MRPKTWSYTPVTTSAAGFADDVTLATAATLAATAATDGLAHRVTILGNAATNHSAKTITVVGTDADGKALTDTIAGPNGVATVTTTYYFKTISSVRMSATGGVDTFDIGWVVDGRGPTIPMDWRQVPFNVGIAVDITGTINYDIEYTADDIFAAVVPPQGGANATVTWINMASPFAGATADQAAASTAPVRAYRVVVNTVTNGATLKLTLIQPTSIC